MSHQVEHLRDEIALVGAVDRLVAGDPDALGDVAYAQLLDDPDYLDWLDHVDDLREHDDRRNSCKYDEDPS